MVRRFALLLLVLAACGGDDGVNHLADAPPPPDAAVDAPPAGPPVSLDVTMGGTGSGTITSSPSGISCGAMCTAEFAKNTIVTLTAVPATGSMFTSWGGACSGTNPTCDVTLADAKNVTATFDIATYTVTVTRAGAGTGTVSGDGIACGSTCTVNVPHGTMISLAAAPGNLSVFAGWGGACSGTAACDVTVTSNTAITANFSLDNLTLFVTLGGNGAGTVTSAPAGINCGSDCSESYVANQMITLTAAPSTGSTFTGWSGGGCSGTGTCMVTMTAATTVTATFTLDTFALTVTKGGNGNGSVVSTPTGIACGSDCTETYDYNTVVTLTPTASTGSSFTGWSGACTGTGPCMVTMTQARTVTATFALDSYVMTVTPTGTGAGTVTGTGITCGSDCMESYLFGTMVTLTAAPSNGSSFGGWGGACASAGASLMCTVTIDMAKSVTATFTLGTNALTVGLGGNGTGSVSSAPAGISCGTDCSELYGFGTMVTLTAAPGTGSSFTGWAGACTGTGTCVVTMDMARSVTATFTLDKFLLTVATSGTGLGQVAATGIDCGFVTSDCTENIDYGTMVTLSATPATGSTFTGWSGGGCMGTGTCTVTITQALTVTAMFTVNTYDLMVTKGGGGSGTVTGTGINCGIDCMESYTFNTMVTLTATPSASSNFAGWSGACTGSGACTVTMTQARNVTATFNLKTFTFSVTRTGGTGTGTVTGGGINCGATCSVTVTYGGSITLAQTPSSANATASTFNGWSGGGCSGVAGCTVTNITANTTVNAMYTLKPNLMFVTSTTYTGALGGLAGADTQCNTRAVAGGLPGNYRAYLSAPGNNASARFGSATGWVRVDGLPFANTIDQFALGTMFNAPAITELNTNVSTTGSVTVWTATSPPTGVYANSVCSSASATVVPWQGTIGSAAIGTATTASSKAVLSSSGAVCTGAQHLYCLGIDRAAIAQ